MSFYIYVHHVFIALSKLLEIRKDEIVIHASICKKTNVVPIERDSRLHSLNHINTSCTGMANDMIYDDIDDDKLFKTRSIV